MKDSLKDQVEGKTDELKGTLKEKIGQFTNNPQLQDEGTTDRVGGQFRKKIGEIKEVFGQ